MPLTRSGHVFHQTQKVIDITELLAENSRYIENTLVNKSSDRSDGLLQKLC